MLLTENIDTHFIHSNMYQTNTAYMSFHIYKLLQLLILLNTTKPL